MPRKIKTIHFDRHADSDITKHMTQDLGPLIRLVKRYAKRDGSDERAALRDILTDAHHLADTCFWDWADLQLGSTEVYREEHHG